MAEKVPIQYWSKGMRDAAARWRPGSVFYAFLYILAFTVATIAGAIEVLNVRAGYVLPNHYYRNGDPADGVITWRHYPWINESKWRQAFGPRDDVGNPIPRPLTAAEIARMHSDIARAIANNKLLDFVSSWGLLQYLFLPTLAVMVVVALANARHKAQALLHLSIPVGVTVVAAALLWHRAYFASLGW